jgi:Forkhead domain
LSSIRNETSAEKIIRIDKKRKLPLDESFMKMCSNKIQMCDTKESDSKHLFGQECSKILDLNQNHRSHTIHSPSPIHSSSSSVSSVSPAEIPPANHSSDPSLVPDINQQQSSGVYERPTEPFFPIPVNNTNGISPMDQYRLQFYNYAMVERLRSQNNTNLQHLYQPVAAYGSRLALSMSLFHNRVFQPEEPKPQHSYIGLIAMAILGVPDQKLVLSDIYQHILDNYPYFRSRGPGWRNSIRHNLSLNDCFIKSGRSANGKGHYWAIHPANIEDFKKGDFRRRKAQRKVRKHMGLAVDEDGTDSPSPPPLTLTPPPGIGFPGSPFSFRFGSEPHWTPNIPINPANVYTHSSRKRQFDVASLLAPDNDYQMQIESFHASKRIHLTSPQDQEDEDIDVVANDDSTNIPCNESNHRRMNVEAKSSVVDSFYANQRPSWNSIVQHLPLGINGMDPRIIGRCYGQYMAQHHQVVNKRLFNSLAFNPNQIDDTNKFSEAEGLIEAGKRNAE